MLSKLLDSWAEKRLQTKAVREAKIEAEKVEELDYEKIIRKELQKELNYHASRLELESCHIKVGDRCIINKYEIGRLCKNGWDGGPNALLNHILPDEWTKPVTVTIKQIDIEWSYAEELIDHWINQMSQKEMKGLAQNPPLISIYYLDYRKKLDLKPFKEYISLYKNALFEIEGSFKPIWGLNVNCFLPEGTTEFDETYSLWAEEIQIASLRKEAQEKLKAVDEKKQAWEKLAQAKSIS